MTNFNDPAISPEPLPSATAIHEAGHAVIGALLGVPPLLVSIEEGEFEYGRTDFPPLAIGELWPEFAADAALLRRHLVVGWAGHCATKAVHRTADELGLGIVPSDLVPTGRLATTEGDLGRILRIADFATDGDPVATGVLVDETEVLADLLLAEPCVVATVWAVAEALDVATTLTQGAIAPLVRDLLNSPPPLATDLVEPEELTDEFTELSEPGFLELPDAAARELLRRSVARISDRYDDPFAPEPEDGLTYSGIARAVAALANHNVGDYPTEVV